VLAYMVDIERLFLAICVKSEVDVMDRLTKGTVKPTSPQAWLAPSVCPSVSIESAFLISEPASRD